MRAHIVALSWSPKKACACTDEVMQRAPAARMRAPMSSTVAGGSVCVSPMSKATSQRRSHWSSARRAPGTSRRISSASVRSVRPWRAQVSASSQVVRSMPRPPGARRTAKAPFSAMAPASGQVQANTSAQPAGRPVTATTRSPAAVARAMAS